MDGAGTGLAKAFLHRTKSSWTWSRIGSRQKTFRLVWGWSCSSMNSFRFWSWWDERRLEVDMKSSHDMTWWLRLVGRVQLDLTFSDAIHNTAMTVALLIISIHIVDSWLWFDFDKSAAKLCSSFNSSWNWLWIDFASSLSASALTTQTSSVIDFIPRFK